MRVLIVGAGVGGLATAQGLAADGHHVTVFEQASALPSGGAAVTIWPAGGAVLTKLGLTLVGAGRRIHTLETRSSTGQTLAVTEVTELFQRSDAPAVTLPRRLLLDRLSADLPAGVLRFGARCVGISTPEGTSRARFAGGMVQARFADGSTAEGDLLIGADEHHAEVRAALSPDRPAMPTGTPIWQDPTPAPTNSTSQQGSNPTPTGTTTSQDPSPAPTSTSQNSNPTPTGTATWQGLGPIPIGLTAGNLGVTITGPEGECGLMPAGDGLLHWWFDVPWSPDEAPPGSPVAEIRRRFGGWQDPVPQVLAALNDDDAELFLHGRHPNHRPPNSRHPIDRHPIDRHPIDPDWGQGPCALVGDAELAAPSLTEQGASRALEDAWQLVRSIRTSPADAYRALRDYERARRHRSAPQLLAHQ